MNCPSGDQQSGLNLTLSSVISKNLSVWLNVMTMSSGPHAGDVESNAMLIRDVTSRLSDHSHLSSSFSFHHHPP